MMPATMRSPRLQNTPGLRMLHPASKMRVVERTRHHPLRSSGCGDQYHAKCGIPCAKYKRVFCTPIQGLAAPTEVGI